MRNFRFSSNFHFFREIYALFLHEILAFWLNFRILFAKFSLFSRANEMRKWNEIVAKKKVSRKVWNFRKRFLFFTGNPSESLPTARIVPLVYFHSTYVERCCSKISFRSMNVGRSMEICRSNLPGRSRALSRTSALNQSLSLSIFIIVNLHHR